LNLELRALNLAANGTGAQNAATLREVRKKIDFSQTSTYISTTYFVLPRKLLVQPSLGSGKKPHRFQIAAIIFLTAILAAAATLWVAKAYLFPKAFKPVQLTAREQRVLDDKIQTLTSPGSGSRHNRPGSNRRLETGVQDTGRLEPEPYSEKYADRQIQLTERELNALLAKNTGLAQKLAIDLSDDLASAKLLVPLDPELPILGGKTLKVTAGLELRYSNQKPVAILRGVSIWGVPIPNAWLGGIKNIDLVSEMGMENGFWRAFAAGIADIRIVDGRLSVTLKE
jgi:hypothetical protein